ncbi:MAG: PqqD family protein [Deltaproteobacteria bacterium]|nr:PqqD family protein [Deltaproteobacteria bacterium]
MEGRFTRRWFIGLSILSGLFYILMPKRVNLEELVGTGPRAVLKRFLLQRSRPVMDTTIEGRWTKDSLVVIMKDESKPLFKLNRTAGFILEGCDGNHTPYDIAKGLRVMFNVNEKRARKDVLNTLEVFYNGGLVRV